MGTLSLRFILSEKRGLQGGWHEALVHPGTGLRPNSGTSPLHDIVPVGDFGITLSMHIQNLVIARIN